MIFHLPEASMCLFSYNSKVLSPRIFAGYLHELTSSVDIVFIYHHRVLPPEDCTNPARITVADARISVSDIAFSFIPCRSRYRRRFHRFHDLHHTLSEYRPHLSTREYDLWDPDPSILRIPENKMGITLKQCAEKLDFLV